MLLNWTGDTPAVRSVLIDSALGLGAPARPWFLQRMADLDQYLSNLPPPKWPFVETNPVNPQMASEGQKIYARDCAACHDPRAEFTSKVIPITEIGTDPERMDSWSKDAAAEANRRVKQLGIDRPPMVETQDPHGYVSPPLDGIWLRAPYLHNGSVPSLRDLLNLPNERPQTFHRGYDVFDPVKVGFKEPPPRPTGPTGELTPTLFSFRHARKRERQQRPHLRHSTVERGQRETARIFEGALKLIFGARPSREKLLCASRFSGSFVLSWQRIASLVVSASSCSSRFAPVCSLTLC
jgi:mono/diheme cytochrome c family protein